MTTTFEAHVIAGAASGGQHRSAQTALAVAVAASVLLHLAALAIRLSSGSGDAKEPVALRPLAVRLITAAAPLPGADAEKPVDREPISGPTRPVVEQRESVVMATAPSGASRTGSAGRDSTARPRPAANVATPPPALESVPATQPPATPPEPIAAATTAYRTSAGLDPPPRPLDDIAPEFPAAAGTRGGTVVLRLLLSETGAIDKIEVVRSNPPGLFEAAALAAFGAARFSPGFLAGTPVRSQIMFEVEFAPQAREGGASSRGY